MLLWAGSTKSVSRKSAAKYSRYFFERALGLVNEVNRLLSTAENDENLVEYYSARLENLLTNCVNLFSIIEEHQYNCIIDAMQTFCLV